jgi:elongation factor G
MEVEMGESGRGVGKGPRCIALVGPYLSGKTTLFEAILSRTGAVNPAGANGAHHSVGDAYPEAREHGMGVELNVAEFEYLGDRFTLLDCPGSVEFQQDSVSALAACDAAVVVCEADERKLPALQVVLRDLEDRGVPRFMFINKIDKADRNIHELLEMLQPASRTPLVLRQIPIWENGIATGFIDLALERAYIYREHAPSQIAEIPADITRQEANERFTMLEKLADYDDELMEQLLSDIPPPRDKVFDDLALELRRNQICPVLLGSAERCNGVSRLLKALRHETPPVMETAERLGAKGARSCARIIRTYHTAHGGKLSLARVLSGSFADGAIAHGPEGEERISGVFSFLGQETKKRGPAIAGDTVGLGRLESFRTGDIISAEKDPAPTLGGPQPRTPVYGLALGVGERKDEIKLASALGKIIDEDPSLSLVQDAALSQMVLWGQGEMHLRVALERLARRYGVVAQTHKRLIPYRETIRKGIEIRGRHKKQSGGHGQFGDVVVEIRPLARGEGFAFSETITGGAIPRNYIPAVEAGVRDFLNAGPLGFPVVDVAVILKDGSYHTVDSSDQAFRAAGRIAMAEGMPKCSPVLLEPIMAVRIIVPSEATPRINAIISSRRGQILGFDNREGWSGWDVIDANIPEAEMHDLIIEVRSATSGAGSYEAKFDHLAELTGKLAEHVLVSHDAHAA